MKENLIIRDLEFEVRRSSRRQTLSLTVDRTGKLVVYSPSTTSKEELTKWVNGKLLWVHQKLLKKVDKNEYDKFEFVSGERILYLGYNYRIKIIKNQSNEIHFDGQWLNIREKDKDRAPYLIKKWYRVYGKEWLSERVKYWEPKIGVIASKIFIRELGNRWGSCGKNEYLYFHWRLLQLSVPIIDYVIVHELIHILEKNHTSTYWKIMDRVLPDWKKRKNEIDNINIEIKL